METSNFSTGREGAEAEAPARDGKWAHTLGGDSRKLLASVPSEAPLPHWGISSGDHHRLLQQPAWTSFQAPPTGNHLGGGGHRVDNGARLPKWRWDLKAPCPAAMPAESPSGRCQQQESSLLPAPRSLAKYAHGPAVAEGGRALLPKENPGSSEHRGLCLLQRSLQRVEEGHRAHLQKGHRQEGEL